MRVLLKSDWKTVFFLNDSDTLNANDDMWQTFEVECETPLIEGKESLWVVFQNMEEPTLLFNESMLERNCDDGIYRILFPDGVIAVPGTWNFQILIRTYDFENEKWVKRKATGVYPFTIEDGLTVSSEERITKVTIASLYSEAEKKIRKETENTEAISKNTANISKNTTDIATNTVDISTQKRQISALQVSVNGELGESIRMSLSSDYVLTVSLLAKSGVVLNTQTVDFPVESMVVGGAYDEENKQIVLSLQNGNTINIPVVDLVDGLISSTEKGQPDGVATLGENGQVPTEQLPDMDYVKKAGDTMYGALTVGGPIIGSSVIGFGKVTLQQALNQAISTIYTFDGITYQGVHFYFPKDKENDDCFVMLSDFDQQTINSIVANSIPLTEAQQKSAKEWLGITDGGDDLKDYVKFTDYATTSSTGVIVVGEGLTISQTTHKLNLSPASTYQIENGNGALRPITVSNFRYAVKVGITTNTETLTEEEKSAAQSWLGIMGASWYKHTMTQTVEDAGETLVYDMLIISARETAYATAAEITEDWNNGLINTFYHSSVNAMRSKIICINNDYSFCGSDGSRAVVLGAFRLSEGVFAYTGIIEKI